MKNTYKIILFLSVLLISLILIPNFSNAETYTVSNSADLLSKVSEAESGDTISLNANIELTSPIEVAGKNLTINGNGYTISRNTTNWTNNGNNGSLITAGNGTTLTLNNLNLRNAAKYGVQAYNGGYVILNHVTIANCEYGGVLVNGGTIEIMDLTLYNNREPGEGNNGIEIGKGVDVTETAKIRMNGTLSSTEDTNVIYIAEDDGLETFVVENAPGTTHKILTDDNKVVVTDENNKVLFTSNETENIEYRGTEYTPNVTVTIKLMNKTVEFSIEPGKTISAEDLKERIDLESLELSKYTIADFYKDADFKEKFNFADPITKDITIYTKLEEITTKPQTPAKPKDETPKTGDFGLGINIAISVLAISTLAAFVFIKRK